MYCKANNGQVIANVWNRWEATSAQTKLGLKLSSPACLSVSLLSRDHVGLEGKKNEHPISEICPRSPNQWQPSLPVELEPAAKERGTKFGGNSLPSLYGACARRT